MRTVLVPNELRDAIYERIDEALKVCPDAAQDRELFYRALLEAYDDLGYIPDFSLEKNQ